MIEVGRVLGSRPAREAGTPPAAAEAAAFELLLFATDPELIRRAVSAGVNGIIVDWEHLGKATRQAGADTQINYHTLADLERVRASTSAPVLCRINGFGLTTADEIEAAIGAGADELLLPMVRHPREVERALVLINGRCRLGILVETVEALRHLPALAQLPLARVYVGLNDLALARGTPNIFTAIADGTVARIRRHFSVPFGFGGLTVPEGGRPIPCRLLMGELARLDCRFTFLRRSFCADTAGRDLNVEIARIRAALEGAWQRPPAAVAEDHARLLAAIRAWRGHLPARERHA